MLNAKKSIYARLGMIKTKVSAIVSNFNGAKFLPKLIQSLEAQVGVDVEVIVVDRQSSDRSLDILGEYQGVKVVTEPPESGLVSGYAEGAKHATSDLFFFCNEDMWFAEDCLRKLVEQIDLANRVGSADPWQWTYDGKIWIHGGVAFEKAFFDPNVPYPFRRHLNTVDIPTGTEIPFGCAGAILIHRSVYEQLGGWDTSFFLDHEDVDFFIRSWQDNWKCVSVPDAKVFHAVGASNSKTTKQGTVSKKRYISGRSSIMTIGVKYFSLPFLPLPFLIILAGLAKNLCCLRLTRCWWTLLAIKDFCSRLPHSYAYRRRRYALWPSKAGEQYFRTIKYQANRLNA